MATLYIHIGFHKTGSTALQYSLLQHSEELKKNNIMFLAGNKSGNSSDFISVNLNRSKATVNITDKFFLLLNKAENKDAIISAEHLSFIEDRSELVKLFEHAKDKFNEIKIVAYVRKQYKLALSFKQQAAKQPHKNASPSSQMCGHDLSSPLPKLSFTLANYLKFDKKYDLWSDVFGKENVIFRLYDKDFLYCSCICKDFSKLLGVKPDLPSVNLNESFSVTKTEVKHFLIQSKAPVEIVNYFNSLSIQDDEVNMVENVLDTSAYDIFFEEHNSRLPLMEKEKERLNEIKCQKYKTNGTLLIDIIDFELRKSLVDKKLVLDYISLIKGAWM